MVSRDAVRTPAPRLTGPLTARFDAGVARFSDLRLCGPLPAGCRLSFALRGSEDVPPVQSERLTLEERQQRHPP